MDIIEVSKLQEDIQLARDIQYERIKKGNGKPTHEQLEPSSISLLEKAMNVYHFSARAYTRIIKVARTIADLDKSIKIQTKHVNEAIRLRSLDRDGVEKYQA
jgi:magnesium chelatase family protein